MGALENRGSDIEAGGFEMNNSVDHLQISGQARPINELFSAARQFTVEYYQREYAWQAAQVEELINDLARSFLSNFQTEHERVQVASYAPYFLGPIITYSSSGVSYLVDGQQRVTTLAMLLLFLRREALDEEQKTSLSSLVYSTSYGTPSFRMNVEARDGVMQALLNDEENPPDDMDSSSANIWSRFQDIQEFFPDELLGVALPFFVDWLQNRVILVEISTPDKNMALEIFESMNDRGLRLTNMDMLKSFVLSRIKVPDRIEAANGAWRKIVNELQDVQKNGDTEFMKNLLRAKYAETSRESGKGSTPKHFEDIGTAFHKWVREQSEGNSGPDGARGAIPIDSPSDFEKFILVEMKVHAKRYRKMIEASTNLTKGWEHTYFNAKNNFTLQYMLGLAVSDTSDDEEVFREKFELVAKFIDLMIVRRMVNFKRRGYSMMYRPMFALAKSIRGQNLDELRVNLAERVEALEESFEALSRFSLTNMNKPDVFYILARMTSWLEDTVSDNYFNGETNSDPFEVEHVWANKYERHEGQFATENEFLQERNRFGALVLLPKSFNASFGAMEFGKKASHYLKQNLLVQTLVDGQGLHNPKLTRKSNSFGLTFTSHRDSFTKEDISLRQGLYRQLCEAIWNPYELGLTIDPLEQPR
jgi:uncharacterized protein with ParB-like and HNH nuclease domain